MMRIGNNSGHPPGAEPAPDVAALSSATLDGMPVSVQPLNVTGLVVTKDDLLAALRLYVPHLVDIVPLDDQHPAASFADQGRRGSSLMAVIPCACNSFPAGLGNVSFGAGIGVTSSVGIGTMSPTNPLHVSRASQAAQEQVRLSTTGSVGDNNFDGLAFDGGGAQLGYIHLNYEASGNSSMSFGTRVAGSVAEAMRINDQGNVGIGTSSPASIGEGGTPRILQVSNGGGSQHFGYLILNSDQTAAGEFTGFIDFGTTGASGEKRSAIVSSQLQAASASNAFGNLQFWTSNGGTPAPRVTIQPNGNVGIGTAAPTQLLQVHSPNVAIGGGYFSSAAPFVALGNDPNYLTATMYGLLGLATATSQYGLPAGDVLLAAFGNNRGNININSNYAGTGGPTNVILQQYGGNVVLGASSSLYIGTTKIADAGGSYYGP